MSISSWVNVFRNSAWPCNVLVTGSAAGVYTLLHYLHQAERIQILLTRPTNREVHTAANRARGPTNTGYLSPLYRVCWAAEPPDLVQFLCHMVD